MPRCGATFDEKNVPPGQGGTSGGFERGNKPTPALQRHPSQEGDFQESSHTAKSAVYVDQKNVGCVVLSGALPHSE